MNIIESCSQEHCEMLLDAITNKQGHILQQIKHAAEAGSKELLVMDSFTDVLMYSSWEDDESERAEILTDARLYHVLTQAANV